MAARPQPPRRPTLEDLLRFKRSERPDPAFWAEFERGLRQKQLSALMKTPRGWARVRPIIGRGMRWLVPAAAAAAVAAIVMQPVATVSNPPAPGFPAQAPIASVAAAVVVPEAERLVETGPVAEPVRVAAVAAAPVLAAHAADPAETPVLFPDSATEELATETVQVADEQSAPSLRMLWADASLQRPDQNSPVYLPVASTTRRPRASRVGTSSWTSSLAKSETPDTWNPSASQLAQLTALDLRVSTAYADNLPTARVMAAGSRRSLAREERQFRELESRFEGRSSGVSVLRF